MSLAVNAGRNSTVSYAGAAQAQSASAESASDARREAMMKQFVAALPGQGDGNNNEAAKRQSEAASRQQAQQRMNEANEAKTRLSSFNKKLQFVVDQKTSDVLIKVIDSETEQVIKILPPEELRRINRGLENTSGSGLLVNQEA